jgi:hypothetical protein
MPENILNPQNLMHQISSIMPHFCDKCGEKHDTSDLEIVFNSSSKAMCKLNCKECGNTYMIHVNSPVDGMLAAKRAQYKSEITANEISKFSNVNNIESNEIIEVFDALKGVKTIDDFNGLF